MTRRLSLASLYLSLLLGCDPSTTVETPPRPTGGPSTQVPLDELDRPLPLDKRLKKGKLANGLTYYVLPHTKPEKRAQIWLAVNAGSVLEDDDQRGLAHFVEHMAFNGTKRFPKNELVNFFEKSGVRFGADLNAYTSFDETVYTLQIPTDQPEVVQTSLAVLRDWADGVTFDPAEVDKERGVVLEEWRQGRGARMRILDKQAPILFHGSKYAERMTIGKSEVIQKAPRDTLVRFYEDWYRPDLMAVIAVGDFDATDIEAKIKAEFESLGKPAKPRPRAAVAVPAHKETLVSIETDPEFPTTAVAIVSKLPHRPEGSARDYRRSISELLFNAMLNARFDEIRRQPDAPFLVAASATSGLVRTADAFRQQASVREDSVERGFGALLEEVLRVERHGFLASELERAKAQLLRQFQQSVKERDKQDGREFAAEIVRNFFEDEAMPGREAELALVEAFLPKITLEEIDGLAKSMAVGSRAIFVTGPAMMAKPTPNAMLALLKDVAARKIEPYVDERPTEPLMDKAPAPGAIAKTTTIPEVGVTEWTLANGVRVIVKPTDFSNDDVRVSAFSPGGHSLASDADFVSAQFADMVMTQGGLGKFDVVKLRKAVAGKLLSLNVQISELEEGLSGRASPTDLETLFQMIHLSFTAPRRDDAAVAAWRAREMETVKNRRLSPERVFLEELQLFSTQNHPRRQPTTPEILGKIDVAKSLAFYQDRFGDAGDFTFLFVGNVDLERLKPLVETYLGSLPSKKRKESWRDPKVMPPKGVQTKTIEMGSEPRSVVSIVFHGSERWSRDTENDMNTLDELLGLRLRQVLREDMGGVYGVQVGGAISRRPREEYRFSVSFGCAPDNVEKLKKAVFDEIADVQKSGVDAEQIDKAKKARRRAHEIELKDNGYWIRELERAYTFGDDPRLIVDIEPMVEKITVDRLKAAATKYASPKQYVLGILTPKAP